MTTGDTTTADTADGADKKSGSAWSFAREVVIVVVCALVLSVVVRTIFVQAFYVPSASMENTLQIDDRILASKITTSISGVKRGEIIVFKDPGGWLPKSKSDVGPVSQVLEFIGLLPSSAGDDLVKRAIALGGDRIICCDANGQIVLNGVALNEPYIKRRGGTDQVAFDVVVPQDSVFVMGDNRGASADSRYHLQQNDGGIPLGNVVGRVVLKVWPLDQFGVESIPDVPFGNPALSEQGVASAPQVVVPGR
ncbi:MAG: signal peptidase I [Actinomycetes bacterium]